MSSSGPQDPTTNTGIAVALAEMRVELRNAIQDIRENRDERRASEARIEGEVRADMRQVKDRLKSLEDAAQRRTGVMLTGRTAAVIVGVAVGVLGIVSALIALVAGGG